LPLLKFQPSYVSVEEEIDRMSGIMIMMVTVIIINTHM